MNCTIKFNINGKLFEVSGVEPLTFDNSDIDLNTILNTLASTENSEMLSAIYDELQKDTIVSEFDINDLSTRLVAYNLEDGLKHLFNGEKATKLIDAIKNTDLKYHKIYYLNNYSTNDASLFIKDDIIFVNKFNKAALVDYINSEYIIDSLKTKKIKIKKNSENDILLNLLNITDDYYNNLKRLYRSNDTVTYNGIKLEKRIIATQIINNLYNDRDNDTVDVLTNEFIKNINSLKINGNKYDKVKFYNYLDSINYDDFTNDLSENIKLDKLHKYLEHVNSYLFNKFYLFSKINETEIVINEVIKSVYDIETGEVVKNSNSVDVKKANVVSYELEYNGSFIYSINKNNKTEYFTSPYLVKLLNYKPRYTYKSITSAKEKIDNYNLNEKVQDRANLVTISGNNGKYVTTNRLSIGTIMTVLNSPDIINKSNNLIQYKDLNYSELLTIVSNNNDDVKTTIQEKLKTIRELILFIQLNNGNINETINKVLKSKYEQFIITKENSYKNVQTYTLKKIEEENLNEEVKSNNNYMFEKLIAGINMLYPDIASKVDIKLLSKEDINEFVTNGVMHPSDRAFVFENNIYINPYEANYSDVFHEIGHIILSYIKNANFEIYQNLLESEFENYGRNADIIKLQQLYPSRARLDLLEEWYVKKHAYNNKLFTDIISMSKDAKTNGLDVLAKHLFGNTFFEKVPNIEMEFKTTVPYNQISNAIQDGIRNKTIKEYC